MADTETLDDLVRRVDPDRWLAARFIGDAAARADVIALYGLNYELARVAGGVSNALMGEIRLTWWREAMEEVAAGKPRESIRTSRPWRPRVSIPTPSPCWPRPVSPTWMRGR
jgi:phytoene/squalene synthetase